MATVSPDRIQIAGTAPTYNAASAGGDKVPPGDDTILHVKNGSAGAITATVVTPGTVAGQPIGDVAVSVPAGGERFIGPLTRSIFAASDGLVDITWSAAASVTFAAIQV
jgi:hypothetical protein